jgi:hypothetical protein
MATTAESSSSGSAPERRADKLDERELRAWRGMLRVHATLTKALDAELEAAHGLPLSSYEVLMHLHDAEGQRMRMSDLASSVILSRSGLTASSVTVSSSASRAPATRAAPSRRSPTPAAVRSRPRGRRTWRACGRCT